MSAGKDSDIIYELVTSKYKIAERNRLAKLHFLNQMKKTGGEETTTVSRRDSEPSLAKVEKTEVKRIDLSVPGTPVSSRYLETLKCVRRNGNKTFIDTDSENEDYELNTRSVGVEPSELSSLLEENLIKFTREMDKLNNESSSHDPLKKYFEESDQKRTYRRDFSEVVSEFPPRNNKESKSAKKVEKYFTESERLNSFKREFNDVVRTFDPKNPTSREQFSFDDLKKVGTPISSRLIATERLSSCAIKNDVEITEPQAISSDAKIDDKNNIEEYKNSQVQHHENENKNKNENNDVNENKLIIIEDGDDDEFSKEEKIESQINSTTKIKSKGSGAENNNELIIMENENDCEVNRGSLKIESQFDDIVGRSSSSSSLLLLNTTDNNAAQNEKVMSNQPKRLTRSDSAASDISIPGTPVSSRHLPSLKRYICSDTDDSESETTEGVTTSENMEITEMAKEFVNEIESLVQKSFDDDKQEIALKKVHKISSTPQQDEVKEKKFLEGGDNKDDTSNKNEKLIIHEEVSVVKISDHSTQKVNNYFKDSEKEKSFARTFSEVEEFNQAPYIPSKDVKERVENYFKESERRGSLKRPFSQAIDYLPTKFNNENNKNLVKPGTPVSSKDMQIKTREQEEKEREIDPEFVKGQEILRKAQEAIDSVQKKFQVNEYFDESKDRQTYQRNFSEVHDFAVNTTNSVNKNPDIEKYFEQSEAQKSFQRTFSEAVQEVEPSLSEILKNGEEKQREKPLSYQRSSRASSISSNCSEISDVDAPFGHKKSKKHKKYGIDKYFATSLYRTAYHRSNSRRDSTEDGEEQQQQHVVNLSDLKIVEDEDVFGETDLLQRTEFQHDDETRVTQGPNDVNPNQSVEFWRDFLKPYNLSIQSEIKITKDELMNNRTLE
jgi:hypothetical protein